MGSSSRRGAHSVSMPDCTSVAKWKSAFSDKSGTQIRKACSKKIGRRVLIKSVFTRTGDIRIKIFNHPDICLSLHNGADHFSPTIHQGNLINFFKGQLSKWPDCIFTWPHSENAGHVVLFHDEQPLRIQAPAQGPVPVQAQITLL